MFKRNEKYEVNRNNLKYDFKRYSPEICTLKTANSQIYVYQYTQRRICFFLVKKLS